MSVSSRSIEIDALGLTVDRGADVPIGVQLLWALRSRIQDGTLSPGDRLPGLRDLAQALGVNANTVRAVYQRLEHEGVITSQQGSGTFVSFVPRTSSAAGLIAANAAREARQTGVDPRDVAALLYVSVPASRAAVDEQVAERARLRTQIAALEQALGKLEARHPNLVPRNDARRQRAAEPRLLGVEELEHIQASLLRRMADIQLASEAPGGADGEPGPSAEVSPPRKRVARASSRSRPATAGT